MSRGIKLIEQERFHQIDEDGGIPGHECECEQYYYGSEDDV